MTRLRASSLVGLSVVGLAAAQGVPKDFAAATQTITAADLMAHIKTLASDEYEGRAPGTKGEELTVAYLTERFKKLGLKPGNPDGTFIQKVPLAGFTPKPRIRLSRGSDGVELAAGDFLARSLRYAPQASVRGSEVVFVGYGVLAPEYGWDAFK